MGRAKQEEKDLEGQEVATARTQWMDHLDLQDHQVRLDRVEVLPSQLVH